MNKLYLLYNNYCLANREREIDEYIPLRFSGVTYQDRPVIDTRKISLNDTHPFLQYICLSNKSYSKITIEGTTKQIISFTLMPNENAYIYNKNLNLDKFIRLQKNLSINTYPNIPTEDYAAINLNRDIFLKIYNNAIMIEIDKNINQCLLIYENQQLGILTDFNFNIAAFVSFNLNKNEINTIKSLSNIKEVSKSNYNHFTQKQCFMKSNKFHNNNNLINVILKLKNINLWNLIYYGLNRFIIDNEFCVEFAIASLMNNLPENSKIITLAGLLPNEYSEAHLLVEEMIDNKDKESILTSEEQFYNKIWFYLSCATEMKDLNII